MLKLARALLAASLTLGFYSPYAVAKDAPATRGESKEIAIVSEVVPVQDPAAPYALRLTSGVVDTVDFEELHARRYLYYLNDYFEYADEDETTPVRVSLWLRGFNFGTQQTKREKAMRLCAFMVRPEVGKNYAGSFDEDEYGAQFALSFFKELCAGPLAQIEAFEDCQARLSRSYLRFGAYGGTIRAACDLETAVPTR